MFKIIFIFSLYCLVFINIGIYFSITNEQTPALTIPLPPMQYKHKKFAIVVICANKINDYKKSLESLLKVRGIKEYDIIVSQSGNNKDVRHVTDSFGLKTITHIDDSKIEIKLARHFQWTFNTVFEMMPNISGIVVVEDDLLFSPDFIEYFELTIPIQENDPTVMAISAWNDNGLKHLTSDPHELRRTTFFPGLGWYLSKDIWKNVLNPTWRPFAWDWYVRDTCDKHGMEIIIPEMPRTYHAAKKGTYMNGALFARLFSNINYNKNETFRWSASDIEHVKTSETYSNYILKLLDDDNVQKIWNTDSTIIFDRRMASKFRIWHEGRRGEWKGIRIIRDRGKYTLLVDLKRYPHYLRPSVTL